jgi:hypothetical protein
VRTARPPLLRFTRAERQVIDSCRTPTAVQAYLNTLPYNTEPPPDPATLRSFRGVIRHRTANCIEGAITAAVILEQHGFPPLVMSLESVDGLDHVLFIYHARGGWGSIARSRDPGLHGRRPVYRTPRALALSYVEPYVDRTGAVTAFGTVDLRVLGDYDWRLSPRNVWKVERLLFEIPHRPIVTSASTIARLRRKYVQFLSVNSGRKPLYYDRRGWTDIPNTFEAGE